MANNVMTKASLQELIATFGRRIIGIVHNDGRTTLLNYADSPQIEKTRFETIDGTDLFVVSLTDKNYKNNYEVFNKVDEIQAVIIAESETAYIDPMLLR